MSVSLLDVNVLLALAWPNHQHHRAARRWFSADAAGGWATCALTSLGFVRLSSNPAYTPEAVSPGEAVSLLGRMTAHPGHIHWMELPPLDAPVLQRVVGHQQVNDAYFVHLARHHDGRVATFDSRLTAHAHRPSEVVVISS